MNTTTWAVPATSANLGPGFDALGVALSLFNTTSVQIAGRTLRIEISGLGADFLARDERNLTVRAIRYFCQRRHIPMPRGLFIREENRIPPGSGLGSSAAAILAGMLAANDVLGAQAAPDEILRLAAEMEGHADNVAPALWGGLTVSAGHLLRRFDLPEWTAAVVTPRVYWPTHRARAVLPRKISRRAAARNIGRAILVTEALRQGDLALLRETMDDFLHQPYRLPHIRGAKKALAAAREQGAAAALSGAGPSLIAFAPPDKAEKVGAAMQKAFRRADVAADVRILQTVLQGARRM